MKTAATLVAFLFAVLGGVCDSRADGPASAPAGKSPEQLGKVRFRNSCDPAVQDSFNRAMALLHSFWANDAIKGFRAVLQRDADCAMAYWGIAVAHQQNPLTAQQPASKAAQEALAGLDRARAIARTTQRERDYIAAIDLVFRDADKIDFRSRRLAYEKAMETLDKALIEQFPNIGMTPAELMKEEQLRDLGDGQKLYTQAVTEITFQ